ncbi:hypothetical protein DFH08DRAFT_801645 [Mycena albidolilacea]|uniref:Uncharacterized protein n=1 Tax=Mycena albidolilacea TaxID=1033008 RepID=A0AAD7AJ14_9AGAR|nr:hypothetical protein DFH08DRAFT_801645 [Mycena albidolilacea]
MSEIQRSEPEKKRDVERRAFHRLLPPITISSFTSRSPLSLALFLKPMNIGARQPLPAGIPLKPTQDPLQVPAAAKPQTQCRVVTLSSAVILRSHIIIPNLIQLIVHLPMFVRRRFTHQLYSEMPDKVFAFVADQTISTDAAKSGRVADSVLTKCSSMVVKAQKIAMGISHCLKLISTASKPLRPRTPVTAISNTRGVCAQLECFSPSPSPHRQRDDQFSDAMGVTAICGT